MIHSPRRRPAWVFTLLACLISSAACADAAATLAKLKLPASFQIAIYSDQVPGARSLARGLNSPNGVAFRNGALYVAPTARCSSQTTRQA